jgi:hypothetical protein
MSKNKRNENNSGPTQIVPLSTKEYDELSISLEATLLELTHEERQVLKAWMITPYSTPGTVARQLGIEVPAGSSPFLIRRAPFRRAVKLLKRLALDSVMTTQDVRLFLSGIIEGTVYDELATPDSLPTLPNLSIRLKAAELLVRIEGYSENYGTANVNITMTQNTKDAQLEKSKYLVGQLLSQIKENAGEGEAIRVLKKSLIDIKALADNTSNYTKEVIDSD